MSQAKNEIREQLRECGAEADALQKEYRHLRGQIAAMLAGDRSLDSIAETDEAKLTLHSAKVATIIASARALQRRRRELAAELAAAE